MQRFRVALALASGAVLALMGSVVAHANVPLTRVSSDPYRNATSFHATEVEPDTFSSGSTIVSAFQAGRFRDGGASNVGFATSTNAGTSYSHGFLPGTTVFATPAGPYARDTDPAVAFDTRHGVWLISSLALNASVVGVAVIVDRSTNGGTAWGSPIVVSAANTSQNYDKDWIACDDTASSPFYGSCYVQWDDFGHNNQLHMAFSRDGGLTWHKSTVPAHAIVIGGQPLVQPGGKVIVPIADGFESTIESFVSTNGGASYTGPFSVAAVTSHTEAGNLRSGPVPTAEIDGAGNVTVAWEDCRFISGCTANDIVTSTSANGTTWSAVRRVPINPVTSGVDHFIPGLAVDRGTSGATARFGLTYYFYPVSNCTTATCQLDVGFIASSNGGATWGAPIQLAGPSTLNTLPQTTSGFMVGDYISTSFVTASTGARRALSVFAVGLAVAGKTCTLGDVTSCNEPMFAPTSPLGASAGANASGGDAVVSTSAGTAARATPVAIR